MAFSFWLSLFAEGLAVGAFALLGIGLVGADFDGLQSAVVFFSAVIGALMNGAADGTVCFGIKHNENLLFRLHS